MNRSPSPPPQHFPHPQAERVRVWSEPGEWVLMAFSLATLILALAALLILLSFHSTTIRCDKPDADRAAHCVFRKNYYLKPATVHEAHAIRFDGYRLKVRDARQSSGLAEWDDFLPELSGEGDEAELTAAGEAFADYLDGGVGHFEAKVAYLPVFAYTTAILLAVFFGMFTRAALRDRGASLKTGLCLKWELDLPRRQVCIHRIGLSGWRRQRLDFADFADFACYQRQTPSSDGGAHREYGIRYRLRNGREAEQPFLLEAAETEAFCRFLRQKILNRSD
ncbi:MAG: hypothetical protein Q4A62_02220 [Eikenella sp.]|nr:hypothetical protein [Eikenella sp.]